MLLLPSAVLSLDVKILTALRAYQQVYVLDGEAGALYAGIRGRPAHTL